MNNWLGERATRPTPSTRSAAPAWTCAPRPRGPRLGRRCGRRRRPSAGSSLRCAIASRVCHLAPRKHRPYPAGPQPTAAAADPTGRARLESLARRDELLTVRTAEPRRRPGRPVIDVPDDYAFVMANSRDAITVYLSRVLDLGHQIVAPVQHSTYLCSNPLEHATTDHLTPTPRGSTCPGWSS